MFGCWGLLSEEGLRILGYRVADFDLRVIIGLTVQLLQHLKKFGIHTEHMQLGVHSAAAIRPLRKACSRCLLDKPVADRSMTNKGSKNPALIQAVRWNRLPKTPKPQNPQNPKPQNPKSLIPKTLSLNHDGEET